MFAVGDIAHVYAPSAGKKKYFLCITIADEASVNKFLFINSDPDFDDQYVVGNERVPCIPPNETQKTCFSFSIILHYTDKQLETYQAEKKGKIDEALAAELHRYAQKITSLTPGQKKTVIEGLASLLPGASKDPK